VEARRRGRRSRLSLHITHLFARSLSKTLGTRERKTNWHARARSFSANPSSSRPARTAPWLPRSLPRRAPSSRSRKVVPRLCSVDDGLDGGRRRAEVELVDAVRERGRDEVLVREPLCVCVPNRVSSRLSLGVDRRCGKRSKERETGREGTHRAAELAHPPEGPPPLPLVLALLLVVGVLLGLLVALPLAGEQLGPVPEDIEERLGLLGFGLGEVRGGRRDLGVVLRVANGDICSSRDV